MATIHREAVLPAPAEEVWAALRDPGQVHRLFPGMLADARLEGSMRVVRFAGGMVAHERIVTIDEARRRLVYAARREGLLHHSAAMQVLDGGAGRARFTWTTDLLPDDLAARTEALVDQGMAALARRWGGADRRGPPA